MKQYSFSHSTHETSQIRDVVTFDMTGKIRASFNVCLLTNVISNAKVNRYCERLVREPKLSWSESVRRTVVARLRSRVLRRKSNLLLKVGDCLAWGRVGTRHDCATVAKEMYRLRSVKTFRTRFLLQSATSNRSSEATVAFFHYNSRACIQ